MCDPHTRKPRGFGFITYGSVKAATRACVNKYHDLNGKRVEVKHAIPQERMTAEETSSIKSVTLVPAVPVVAKPSMKALAAQPSVDVSYSTAPRAMAHTLGGPSLQPIGPSSSMGEQRRTFDAFESHNNYSSATAALSLGLRAGYGDDAFRSCSHSTSSHPHEESLLAQLGGAQISASPRSTQPPQQHDGSLERQQHALEYMERLYAGSSGEQSGVSRQHESGEPIDQLSWLFAAGSHESPFDRP